MKNLLFVLVVWSSLVFASDCEHLYAEPISIPNTAELCNSFYATQFDVEHKRVMLVSERLVRDTPVGKLNRHESFRGDLRLKQSTPLPTDYTRSGYDRGHMVPADDASTTREMYDTFLMSNMTPQEPTLNRYRWKALEIKVREMFYKADSDVFVLTVAEYTPPHKMMGTIPVPSGYWKIVYIDGKKRFFYAENAPNARVIEKKSTKVSDVLTIPTK